MPNIRTEIKTPPIVENVEISHKTPEIPEISYEKLYEESQRELAALKEQLNQNINQHQIQLQEVAETKDAALEDYKNETKIMIASVKSENMEYDRAKQEIVAKYDGVTQEMTALITQHNSDAFEIKKLTEKNKSLKEELDLAYKAKAHLENETLALSNRLTNQQNTIEDSHHKFVAKYKYMSHNESQALKQERDQLQKTVEKSEKTMAIIKNELNALYKKDVGISKKLVAYLEDLQSIEKTIASLTDNLHEISQKKTTYISQIDSQKHALDILGIIDAKTRLSEKDIAQLTDRIKQIENHEKIITSAQTQVQSLIQEEKIIIAKLKDQHILRAKRQELLIEQISAWINEKSTYYAQHELPLDNEDSLDKYVEKLKQSGKFPAINKIDNDKKEYNFREYYDYIKTKNYNSEAINRRLPEVIRYTNERELALVTRPKLLGSLPKTADEVKVELMKEFDKKPVINAEQERMNQLIMQSIHYKHRPLPLSKHNSVPIYRPQTTTVTNENQLGIESTTNKSTDMLTTNPSNAQSLVD